MTRKATLSAWAAQLGADVPADPTVAQLEAAIESAISRPVVDTPSYSLREGFAANLAVLRQELPATIAAVRRNLLGIPDDGIYLLSESTEETWGSPPSPG
jgi:hypothetical protein